MILHFTDVWLINYSGGGALPLTPSDVPVSITNVTVDPPFYGCMGPVSKMNQLPLPMDMDAQPMDRAGGAMDSEDESMWLPPQKSLADYIADDKYLMKPTPQTVYHKVYRQHTNFSPKKQAPSPAPAPIYCRRCHKQNNKCACA